MMQNDQRTAPTTDSTDPFAFVEGVDWHKPVQRSVMASVALGAWMSAALDDPKVCDAMKADIQEWFSAGEPVETLCAALAQRRADSTEQGMQVIDLYAEFFNSLVKAANESNWIPPEYYTNDWVSDCCDFLRTGKGFIHDSTDLEARLRRSMTDPQRMLWRDDVESICRSPDICFEYGEHVRCGPCAIRQAAGVGVVTEMGIPNLPEVYRLTRELAAKDAEITQLRDKLARTVVALTALQDAERRYRQEHDLHGDGSAKAGYAWDVMRRKGDAARQALKDTAHD